MHILKRLNLLFLVILFTSILQGCATYVNTKPGATTTIIITRHAERTAITKVLTERGRARARDLVKAVGDMKINAIYSPDLVRNLDTVRPLAKHLGIEITVVSKKPVAKEVVDSILSRHAGETVLWVGNTTNISNIYNHLGGEGDAPDNYGDLCIMKIKEQGPPEVIKKRYGAL